MGGGLLSATSSALSASLDPETASFQLSRSASYTRTSMRTHTFKLHATRVSSCDFNTLHVIYILHFVLLSCGPVFGSAAVPGAACWSTLRMKVRERNGLLSCVEQLCYLVHGIEPVSNVSVCLACDLPWEGTPASLLLPLALTVVFALSLHFLNTSRF